MYPLGSQSYGTRNVYAMRIYTCAPGEIPQVLEGWAKAIPARKKYSSLAAYWESKISGLKQFVHVWDTSVYASIGLPPLFDPIRHALGDHDRRSVCVGTHHIGHNRGIDHPQTL